MREDQFRAAEERPRRTTEEATLEQRRLADAGELAAGVAHDLGNALAVLKLHAQLVLMHPDLPAEIREQVIEMEIHTDLAHDLVREVMPHVRQQPTGTDLE